MVPNGQWEECAAASLSSRGDQNPVPAVRATVNGDAAVVALVSKLLVQEMLHGDFLF